MHYVRLFDKVLVNKIHICVYIIIYTKYIFFKVIKAVVRYQLSTFIKREEFMIQIKE